MTHPEINESGMSHVLISTLTILPIPLPPSRGIGPVKSDIFKAGRGAFKEVVDPPSINHSQDGPAQKDFRGRLLLIVCCDKWI